MKFAKWVFAIAGVYGVLLIAPMFFSEAQIGRDFPPPITHPEYFYGFVGVTLAWQLVFLLIAADPAGLRRVMLPSIAEKAAFGLAAVVLFVEQRTGALILGFGCIDLVLGVLFIAAYRLTGSRAPVPSRSAGSAAGAAGNA